MKKKFINGMLLVAMFFATMGTFVSCKDYDEDAYAKLAHEDSTLKELIETQVSALNGQIDALKKAQDECKKNCETWKQEIQLWQEYVANNYVTVEEYNKHITQYTAFVAENKSQHEALEKKINEVQTALQKNLDDSVASLNAKIMQLQILATSVQSQLESLTKTVANNKAELEKAIADNKTELEGKITSEIAKLETRVAANEIAIATLTTALADLTKKVGDLDTLLNKTVKAAAKAQALAEADSIRIDALVTEFTALKEGYDALEDEFAALKENEIDSICKELNKIKESVNSVAEQAAANLKAAKEYTDLRIAEVMTEITSINTTLGQLENAYKDADAKLQDQLDALTDKVNALDARVAANEKAIDGLFATVNTALMQYVSGIILQGTENPVFGSFAMPMNVRSNVLMAYYGRTGSYGLQFPAKYPRYYANDKETLSEKDIEMLGVTPTMFAEDGEIVVSKAGKVYVTVNPSTVNFEGQVLPIVNSLDEESAIKLSGLKYSDKKLTFGYSRSATNGFYEAEATLAPADVHKVAMTFDFNGTAVKNTIKDILNPTNGINVAQAASTIADVLQEFNQQLDANALKATWTDTLGVTRSVYSQYNLAATAVKPLSYSFMQDLKVSSFPGFDKMETFVGKVLDKIANKLKVSLPDMTFDLDIKKIDEIKFNTIDINTDDINLDLTVTYKNTISTKVPIKIEDLVDIDFTVPSQTITIDVPVKGDVVNNEGNVVGSFDTTVKKEIVINPQEIQDQVEFVWEGTVDVEVPIDIEIPVDMNEFKKMIDEIEGLEDDINGMLSGQQDNINNIINTINNYLEQLGDLTEIADKYIHIEDKIDDLVEKDKQLIVKFLDKLEGKLVAGLNSINKVMQPVMLAKTTSGFSVLSQTVYNPTRMSAGNVKFIPTSYNAELVAPAYKKLVGVTNVYSMDRKKNAQSGDATCLAALKKANSKAGVAEILDGDVLSVNFSAERGYIYEVTYTSVDYSGQVAAKKYYVTVK